LGVMLSAETAGRIATYITYPGLVMGVEGCFILAVAFMVEILQLMQSESGFILMGESFQTSAADAASRALLGLTNLA
jgi:hypothetical protein